MRRLFRGRPDRRDCEEVRALFSDYLDEELEEAAQLRVDEHVALCPACRQALANVVLIVRRLRGLSGAAPPGAAGPGEVAERLRRPWRQSVARGADE